MTSARSRLLELPEAFHCNQLTLRYGFPKETSGVFLSRWERAGLVKKAGPRSGWWFNLVRNQNAPAACRMNVLLAEHPRAVVGGATVLHDCGWTDQIPARTDVLIPGKRNPSTMYGFNVRPAGERWLGLAQPRFVRDGSIPRLPAADALIELLFFAKGQWSPKPDDLDESEVDFTLLAEAAKHYGVSFSKEWTGWLEDNGCEIQSSDVSLRRKPRA